MLLAKVRDLPMRVSDIMTAHPLTVALDDSLGVAIERMQSIGCRRLPVVNQDGALVGIITDRDTRLALHSPYLPHDLGEDVALLQNVPVRAIMTPAPITVEPTSLIEDAISLMITHRIGGLPVLKSESVVGVVTSTDIMTAFARYLRREQVSRERFAEVASRTDR